MHKLKWVKPTEVGSAPSMVTASNPTGAGRKPDGSRLAAQARGDDRYWTPRLCRRVASHNVDGLCERRIDKDSTCVRCGLEQTYRYKAGNKERVAEWQRRWARKNYANNREAELARSRARYWGLKAVEATLAD